MSPRSTIIASAAGVALISLVSTADAKIVCRNGNQLVEGSWLATPYCQDALVAEVARQYGFSATASQVRSNPMFKQRLCRFIGQDIRIKESCDQVNPTNRGGVF